MLDDDDDELDEELDDDDKDDELDELELDEWLDEDDDDELDDSAAGEKEATTAPQSAFASELLKFRTCAPAALAALLSPMLLKPATPRIVVFAPATIAFPEQRTLATSQLSDATTVTPGAIDEPLSVVAVLEASGWSVCLAPV